MNDDSTAKEGELLTGEELIMTLDKDALEMYARDNFGRELDKRKKIETLQAEVIALERGETQKAEAEEADLKAELDRRNNGTPSKVRHKFNGRVYDWNKSFKGNADLEVIEWK